MQTFIVAFSVLCVFTACTNNNQSTKSSPYDSSSGTASAPPPADTSMSNMPAKDTSMADNSRQSAHKAMATKRKGKATAGTLGRTNRAITSKTMIRPDKNGVYDMTEVRPSYPGGRSALENYVTNRIEYPQMAIDDSKEGTVNVQFIVNENGKVQDAKVIGSKLGDGLDEEAERIVSGMPNWNAGMVKGKPVKTRVTLPIIYKIEE